MKIKAKQQSTTKLSKRSYLILSVLIVTICWAALRQFEDAGGASSSSSSSTTLLSLATTNSATTNQEYGLQQQKGGGNERPLGGSSIIKPLHCTSFLEQVKKAGGGSSNPVMVDDPNKNGTNYTVAYTSNTPNPFWVSLHNEKFDPVRWRLLEQKRYYETVQEDIWKRILLTDAVRYNSKPGDVILDVGGNIGYYSLLSASLGNYTVHAFEPNPKNNLRFCESLALNGWDNSDNNNNVNEAATQTQTRTQTRPIVNIYPYGISDRGGSMSFAERRDNPGAGIVVPSEEQAMQLRRVWRRSLGPVRSIRVTTLDTFARERGWFDSPNPPRIQILKLDVEKHEALALLGAQRLVRSGMVRHVFSEVSAEGNRTIETAALQLLVDSGYRLRAFGGRWGPEYTNTMFLPGDENMVEKLLERLEQEKRKYYNVWWELPDYVDSEYS